MFPATCHLVCHHLKPFAPKNTYKSCLNYLHRERLEINTLFQILKQRFTIYRIGHIKVARLWQRYFNKWQVTMSYILKESFCPMFETIWTIRQTVVLIVLLTEVVLAFHRGMNCQYFYNLNITQFIHTSIYRIKNNLKMFMSLVRKI